MEEELQTVEAVPEGGAAQTAEGSAAQTDGAVRLETLRSGIAAELGLEPDAAYEAVVSALEGRQQARQGAQGLYGDWVRQAEALRQSQPDFDLRREAKNPEFVRLLRGGADVETAFRAAHIEELLRDGMHFAARETARRTAARVSANGLRPHEHGGSSAAVYRTDVSLLTDAELEDISRRVRRGERISFG